MSEFDEWAKRFEPRTITGWSAAEQKTVDVHLAAQCMYAIREGPHKRACHKEAECRSKDDYPACKRHKVFPIRKGWVGHVEGA